MGTDVQIQEYLIIKFALSDHLMKKQYISVLSPTLFKAYLLKSFQDKMLFIFLQITH